MADWGDIAWETATPEYRKRQFVALSKALVENGEHTDAALYLADDEPECAEAIYDAVDDGIAAAEADDVAPSSDEG